MDSAYARFAANGPGKSSNEHPECGTYRGYNRHTDHGEPACQPCKDAWAEYRRVNREQTKQGLREPKVIRPAECGTRSGYNRHVKDKTPICQPCGDAYNAEQREAHARREAARKASQN